MQTPKFWPALDRLGTDGASRLHWRRELDGAFDSAKIYLRRLPGIAGHVPDPDDPRGLVTLSVYPDEGEDFVAVSEETPSHRTLLALSAEDVALLAPDWEAIRPALAELLGFTPLAATVQHSGVIRQLGLSQPEIGRTVPVFLYLPHGSFSDPHVFLTSLHQLPEGVLYVPTRRHLVAAVFAVANTRKVSIEAIADRISQQPHPATTTLTVAATSIESDATPARRTKARPILAAQPGRTWGKLVLRLTEKGTLIARYGQPAGRVSLWSKSRRGWEAEVSRAVCDAIHRLHRKPLGHPPRTHKTYAATQRNFARLRELLQKLTLIDGDPLSQKRRGMGA